MTTSSSPPAQDPVPVSREEATNLVARWFAPPAPWLSRSAAQEPAFDEGAWEVLEHPGLGWSFTPTRTDTALGVVVSHTHRVEPFVLGRTTADSAFQQAAHLDAVDLDPPYGPSAVREWLTDLAVDGTEKDRDMSALRSALLATLEALGADALFNWGPAPGSKAEGAYERAHQAFYALERELRQAMTADDVER